MSEQNSENCQVCGKEHFDTDLKTIKLSGLDAVLSVCEPCVLQHDAVSSFKDAAEILQDIISIANSNKDPERRIRAIKTLIGE